jgi:hypothetical protein
MRKYPFAPQTIDCFKPTLLERLRRAVAALIERIATWTSR